MKIFNIAIAVPIYYREEKVRKCLESLLETDRENEKYKLNFKVGIGINGCNQVFLKYLTEVYASKLNFYGMDRFLYIPSPFRNLGKPEIVNLLIKEMCRDFDINFVVSLDSDMVLIEHNWLLEMIDIFENWNESIDLGALAPMQLEHNCHQMGKPVVTEVCGHRVLGQLKNMGIAGGLFVIPYAVWKKIGGYRARRIFASDDGDFGIDCARHDLAIGVVEDIHVRHPLGDAAEYMEWKVRASRDQLKDEEKQGYQF